MDIKKIGKRIHDTRNEYGYTLRDIAAEVGVADSTIQRLERGLGKQISLPIITAVASFLEVNPSWLIYKSEEKYISSNETLAKTSSLIDSFDDLDYAIFDEMRDLDSDVKFKILKNIKRIKKVNK